MPSSLQSMVTEHVKKLGATFVIEGGSTGADRMARVAAVLLGIAGLEFRAHWEKHGLAAGPLRNQRMLDEGEPDALLAFHPKAGITPGTADMVRRAEAKGIPVHVVTY